MASAATLEVPCHKRCSFLPSHVSFFSSKKTDHIEETKINGKLFKFPVFDFCLKDFFLRRWKMFFSKELLKSC